MPDPTLETRRQAAAQKAYEDYDFGDHGVEGADGWEWTQPGKEWMRKLYFTPDTEDQPSVPGHFTVRFAEGSDAIAECYALRRGAEIGRIPAPTPAP